MKRSGPASSRRSLSLGFTLIEIMIAVAVVAILASVAYPSYMDSVRRGWRAEARSALMQEMQQQERIYTQRGKYKTDGPHKEYSGDTAENSKYDIKVDACQGRQAEQCIVLTAELRPGFSDSAVENISIDSTGKKSCSGPDKGRCWQ